MIWLFYLPCPMAYSRTKLLLDQFDCTLSSIWLLPGGTSSVVPVPLFGSGFERVALLQVHGDK